MGFFVWDCIFISNLTCIQVSLHFYLRGMRPMGVIACFLVSLVVYLDPQMDKVLSPLPLKLSYLLVCVRTQLYFNLSVKFDLVGPHIKSLVTFDFAPYV